MNGYITLCFDDGWKSVYDNAFPILKHHSIRATHYIISGYLDPNQFPAYMQIHHLHDLQAVGHEIGCHTVAHRHLLTEPTWFIQDELMLSRAVLEKHGFMTETLAYPYGEYDERVLSLAKAAGFIGARTSTRGFNDLDSDPFQLCVQAVKYSTTIAEISSWIKHAQVTSSWLILMFHQVDHEGREWSTSPEMLSAIVEYISKAPMNTLTVSEGINRMWTNHKQ